MAVRKVWVKRGSASATQVAIGPDDLVDDVRDAVIRKYLNSLGRTFDAPDVSLKIRPREQATKGGSERILAPDEHVLQLIAAYYPGGQSLDEALIIDVPQRRTPKPSPRLVSQLQPYYIPEEAQPREASEYFPPMPAVQSPALNAHGTLGPSHASNSHLHSMAVLTTGQLPPLSSPGGRSNRLRPKNSRQHTSSPTVLHPGQPNSSIIDQNQVPHNNAISPGPPLATSPSQQSEPRKPSINSPAPAVSSQPNHRQKQGRRRAPPSGLGRKDGPRHESNLDQPPPQAAIGLAEAAVPPINVLLVEDNVINLKLLEAFMKRLKVRWKTAMDGKEAVAMWRTGGFHLVLMDIQLPVMNGLEATKEIRRLEALNRIGVLCGSPLEGLRKQELGVGGDVENDNLRSEDRLASRVALFKSPVIIVALTASSLQSDRHEALAAGCNDFLTKPVNFLWMERKVTEWGCMQALIDFDGWRKWKDLAAKEQASKESRKGEVKADQKAALKAMFSQPPKTRKEREREREKEKEKEKESTQSAMSTDDAGLQRITSDRSNDSGSLPDAGPVNGLGKDESYSSTTSVSTAIRN